MRLCKYALSFGGETRDDRYESSPWCFPSLPLFLPVSFPLSPVSRSTTMSPSPDTPSPGPTFPQQQHPASVDLFLPTTLRHGSRSPLDHISSGTGTRKHHPSLAHHRPHLHLRHGHHHRRSIDSTARDSLESTARSPPRIDTDLLNVPKTYEPHARRIDSSSSNGERKASSGETEPRQNDDGQEEDGASGKGHESPLTPDPKDIPQGGADVVPAIKDGATQPGQEIRSVWDQVRYELDEEPGVTPA